MGLIHLFYLFNFLKLLLLLLMEKLGHKGGVRWKSELLGPGKETFSVFTNFHNGEGDKMVNLVLHKNSKSLPSPLS